MQQDKITIDLKLPTKWEDLSDKQLRYVFALLAQGYTATEVKAYCLHRWAGLKVLHRYGNVWACKHDGLNFVLAAEQVERATHALDWLDSVPTLPVRLAKIGSHRAIDAQFQGCRLRRSSSAITFRQFMSKLILEKTKLENHCIYIDPRISFNEIDRYFFSGCACAYFQIAVDVYTDLRINPDEWNE